MKLMFFLFLVEKIVFEKGGEVQLCNIEQNFVVWSNSRANQFNIDSHNLYSTRKSSVNGLAHSLQVDFLARMSNDEFLKIQTLIIGNRLCWC